MGIVGAALGLLLTGGVGFAQVAAPPRAAAPAGHNFAQWEKEIAAYERADQTNPPPKGAALFIGSSTVARWKTLAQDFPGHPVINRGFGGSEIVDSTHFADRVIFPYAPRQVFLRAGTNDIHAGKSPEQVFADFKEFVAVVHAKLPETEIVFISLNPAPSRWKEAARNKAANALIARYARETPRVIYVDVYDIPFTPDGKPRPELFVEDMLHFNAEGYKLLTARVRPYLHE